MRERTYSKTSCSYGSGLYKKLKLSYIKTGEAPFWRWTRVSRVNLLKWLQKKGYIVTMRQCKATEQYFFKIVATFIWMLHDVFDGYYIVSKYLAVILKFTIGEKRVSDVLADMQPCHSNPQSRIHLAPQDGADTVSYCKKNCFINTAWLQLLCFFCKTLLWYTPNLYSLLHHPLWKNQLVSPLKIRLQ